MMNISEELAAGNRNLPTGISDMLVDFYQTARRAHSGHRHGNMHCSSWSSTGQPGPGLEYLATNHLA
jgi:hypothetical protein